MNMRGVIVKRLRTTALVGQSEIQFLKDEEIYFQTRNITERETQYGILEPYRSYL